FELGFGPIQRAAKNSRDNAYIFAQNRGKQRLKRLAARLTPEAFERLTLDFAGKQRADARAGEAKSDAVNEVRCEHKGIAEDMANVAWIDVRAGRRLAPSASLAPVLKQSTGGSVFHCDTCSVAACRLCPRSGQARCFF